MGIQKGIRQIAGVYRNSARVFLLIVLAASLVMAAVHAQPSSSPSLSISTTNVTSTTCWWFGTSNLLGGGGECSYDNIPTGSTGVTIQGTVGVSGGGYTGPIYFAGSAKIFVGGGPLLGGLTPNGPNGSITISLTPGNFGSNPMSYPSSTTTSFSVQKFYANGGGYNIQYYNLNITGYSDPGLTHPVTTTYLTSGGTDADATFAYIVELPVFNDTSLGATAPASCGNTVLQPCFLPSSVATMYNYLAIIAVIIAAVGAMIKYGAGDLLGDSQGGGKRQNFMVDIGITVVFIFAFPFIYNQIAGLLNYLNASVITGPSNPAGVNSLDYAIGQIWQGAQKANGLSWNTFFSASFFDIASWMIDVFVYIAVYVLGPIRLWLLTVMIVAFPISLALKQIPFTEKLSGMVEDTLYGLMLASLLSSIILGVAYSTTSGGLGSTIFGGADSNFVFAMALFTALMMPTVMAPLVGTLFQTGMQMVMAAGSVAEMVGTGVVSGGAGAIAPIGGLGGIGGAIGGMGGGGAAAQVGGGASTGMSQIAASGGVSAGSVAGISKKEKAMWGLGHAAKAIGFGGVGGFLAGATGGKIGHGIASFGSVSAGDVAASMAAKDASHKIGNIQSQYGFDVATSSALYGAGIIDHARLAELRGKIGSDDIQAIKTHGAGYLMSGVRLAGSAGVGFGTIHQLRGDGATDADIKTLGNGGHLRNASTMKFIQEQRAGGASYSSLASSLTTGATRARGHAIRLGQLRDNPLKVANIVNGKGQKFGTGGIRNRAHVYNSSPGSPRAQKEFAKLKTALRSPEGWANYQASEGVPISQIGDAGQLHTDWLAVNAFVKQHGIYALDAVSLDVAARGHAARWRK